MIDYPRPSSPTLTAIPPSPLAKHSRRSHSPVPRIATLLPSHHSEYSPSSRAADISRLLDPAYSSTSSSSSAGSSSRAYVDHRGDLHDPDYRDFPLYAPQHVNSASRIRSTTTTRKQRRTSASSARSHSTSRDRRYSGSNYLSQPTWDRAVDSDEFDDDDVSDSESQSHFSPFSSSDSRARRTVCYSHYFGEHIPMSASPVSLAENALQLEGASLFEEEDASELRVEQPRKLRRNSRRRSVESKMKEEVSEPQVEDVEQEPDSASIPHIASGGDYVPSCTHSLQRQWQTLSLRIRFGVFHAKQRLRRSLRH
ncbi:hypothetical protein EUX98_g4359 [Antrodiella citrinella]|uniref:Uncharacterized protein n=1 Tax=Antrodiella citrinella TaxID=2447956 RepID=A0A4S4N270_9APHY|nr:hypothetical protein EUX98_g4359 [Antrodiella citrinella]